MFLLPSVAVGIVLAVFLGGKPSRLFALRFRGAWLVFLALAIQVVLFSRLGAAVPDALGEPLHLASYALLVAFAVLNARNLALLPLTAGMLLNAVAIAANGGDMPVSGSAWQAAGLDLGADSNVRPGAGRLWFLGDVFTLPGEFPLANVFSVGDILVAAGVIALIVSASLESPDRTLAPSRLLEPLASGGFRQLAAGRLVSQLGDWLTLAALVGWIYEETGSTGDVALLLLVRLAPPILGGGLAAVIVDRLRKERLLVAVELARGLTVAGALAAVLLGSLPAAFLALGLSGALAAVGSATVPALVPSLLGKNELAAANAGLGIAQDGAMALGALGAGIALTAASPALALSLDLATFALAAAFYARIRTVPLARGESEAGGGFLPGLRYLVTHKVLLTVVIAFCAATLATGLTNATLPRLLDGELGLGSGGYGFGLAALAGGLAAGQALVGFTGVGKAGRRWIGAALLVMSALFALLAYTRHAPTAILLLGVIGIVDGTSDVVFDTVVQRSAHARYHGRVFAFAGTFMATSMMAAVAVAPLLNHLVAPRVVILVAGLGLLVAGAVALFGDRPARGRKERALALAEGEAALARRETALAADRARILAKLREVEQRERRLAEREAALTGRERALHERAEDLDRKARELEERLAAARTRETPSNGSLTPEAWTRLRTGSAWNVDGIVDLVERRVLEFPGRADEWASYLFYLRGFASPDGTLPTSFNGLVEDVFSDALPPEVGSP